MNNTRNEIEKLASTMESLAHEIRVRLKAGQDILGLSNELVRNNSTFVFTLGEMYALEQVGSTRTVQAKKVSAPSGTHRNYHNLRDTTGRFTRKV